MDWFPAGDEFLRDVRPPPWKGGAPCLDGRVKRVGHHDGWAVMIVGEKRVESSGIGFGELRIWTLPHAFCIASVNMRT